MYRNDSERLKSYKTLMSSIMDPNDSMAENKKIAIIMHVPASYGGGGFYEIKTMSNLLSTHGFDIHIYEPFSSTHPNINSHTVYRDYDSTALKFLKSVGKPGLFPPILDIHLESHYDIVYTFSPFYFLFIYKNRAYLRKIKKVVISTKDLLFPETFSKRILRYLTILFYKLINLENMEIHNENLIENELLSRLNMRMYVAPIPPDTNFSDCNFETNNVYTILFLGTIEKRKGADILFKILNKFRNNRDIQFKIAGKISKEYEESAKNISSENIIFLGEISEHQKEVLLFKSDLGMMLSLTESYSLVTREMLLHGLPVLTTWKYASKIFGEFGILVSERSVNALYLNINNLMNKWLSSRGKYNEWRCEILKEYNDRMRKDNMERQFLSIFDI